MAKIVAISVPYKKVQTEVNNFWQTQIFSNYFLGKMLIYSFLNESFATQQSSWMSDHTWYNHTSIQYSTSCLSASIPRHTGLSLDNDIT